MIPYPEPRGPAGHRRPGAGVDELDDGDQVPVLALREVVRRDEDSIRRYLHIGTGNYNPHTGRLYTDLGLFTCRPDFGEDATNLFNLLDLRPGRVRLPGRDLALWKRLCQPDHGRHQLRWLRPRLPDRSGVQRRTVHPHVRRRADELLGQPAAAPGLLDDEGDVGLVLGRPHDLGDARPSVALLPEGVNRTACGPQ